MSRFHLIKLGKGEGGGGYRLTWEGVALVEVAGRFVEGMGIRIERIDGEDGGDGYDDDYSLFKDRGLVWCLAKVKGKGVPF